MDLSFSSPNAETGVVGFEDGDHYVRWLSPPPIIEDTCEVGPIEVNA